MKPRHGVLFFLMAILAVPVFAGHGRTGLWENKSVTTENGRSGSVTMTVCRTKSIAEHPESALQLGASCRLQNARWIGESFDADIVCQGDMTGIGKVRYRFHSPEHYTGRIGFKGRQNGAALDVVTTVDAHFVAADCGDVKP